MNLEEIERIKQLKYAYLRSVDLNDWELFASCFTEDASTHYENGTLCWQGIENIIAGLRPLIGAPTTITQHQVHHPVIELTSSTTASGSWYLQDIVYELSENYWFHGTAYYADEYVQVDGVWKIQRTGFDRVLLIRESPIPENMRFEYDRFAAQR